LQHCRCCHLLLLHVGLILNTVSCLCCCRAPAVPIVIATSSAVTTTDQQDSEEGSQYTGSHSSYSGQSEGPIDGEDWGNPALAGDADAAQEQQPEAADDVQDGFSLPHNSVDALGVIEPDAAAQGAAAAAAGGDVEAEIAEALAAAEAAASAAAAAGAAPAAAGGVPVLSALSLEEEIAQALAAAVAAGSSAAAAASDS
jgi:hypothetical protein